jgi:hypothetical protein
MSGLLHATAGVIAAQASAPSYPDPTRILVYENWPAVNPLSDQSGGLFSVLNYTGDAETGYTDGTWLQSTGAGATAYSLNATPTQPIWAVGISTGGSAFASAPTIIDVQCGIDVVDTDNFLGLRLGQSGGVTIYRRVAGGTVTTEASASRSWNIYEHFFIVVNETAGLARVYHLPVTGTIVGSSDWSIAVKQINDYVLPVGFTKRPGTVLRTLTSGARSNRRIYVFDNCAKWWT